MPVLLSCAKLKTFPTTRLKITMAVFSSELRPVMMSLKAEDVVRLLDLPLIARLYKMEENPAETLNMDALIELGLLKRDDQGLYLISGIAGFFFARTFSPFPTLARTGIRVVRYPGTDKSGIPTPRFFDGGYARTFTEAVQFVRQMTPAFDTGYAIDDIRFLLANLLSQRAPQDPAPIALIEIFDDRIEFFRSGDDDRAWANPKTADLLKRFFFKETDDFNTLALLLGLKTVPDMDVTATGTRFVLEAKK